VLLRLHQWDLGVPAHSDASNTLVHREETVRRLLLLVALYAMPVVWAIMPIIDPDIWWHLRTGRWIIEHGTAPMLDWFSIFGMGKLWVAYSWLFELLVYGLYRVFGLVGLVLYTAVLALMVALALHALVRRFEPRFPVAVVLTGLALCAIFPLLNPRPWLLTILFFVIVLDILLTARQLGDTRRLWLLPLLFALWANVHIQFIYGLFVLGLATAEPLIDRFLRRSTGVDRVLAPPLGCMLYVTTACVVATLATPYHVLLYRTLFEVIVQTGPLYYISEMQALSFRSLSDWCVLATVLGAVFSLAWQRQLRPFPLLLLVAGCFLSFRASRDVWFVVVAAVAIIATAHAPAMAVERFRLTKFRALLVAVGIIVVCVVVSHRRDISERSLEARLARTYPAAAAAVIEERGYTGPLYNSYNWGGYLIWRLPHLPVAMDGRANLHGDERIQRALETWSGKRSWASDPELAAARLVISSVDWPLASLLRLDARFELVHEDEVAAVFIRTHDRQPGTAAKASREEE
jgi:hypothetical protein